VSVPDNCCKMYGPPHECKKNWVGREAVCENVPGLWWRVVSGRMMMIRACPSLISATVMKDRITVAGSRARRLTVFSPFFFFCRLLRSEFQLTSSRWLS
jgi:hypothetical protein